VPRHTGRQRARGYVLATVRRPQARTTPTNYQISREADRGSRTDARIENQSHHKGAGRGDGMAGDFRGEWLKWSSNPPVFHTRTDVMPADTPPNRHLIPIGEIYFQWDRDDRHHLVLDLSGPLPEWVVELPSESIPLAEYLRRHPGRRDEVRQQIRRRLVAPDQVSRAYQTVSAAVRTRGRPFQ
jgi:hypothetical protein